VTFAFSWVCEIVAFGLLDLDFVIGVVPAIFGPALGAYGVIRACDGSAGVHAWMRRLLQWRVDWRLYLFALGALPGLVIAAYVFLPKGAKKLGDAGIAAPASYLSLVVIMSLHTAVGEELGWRGFALPRLQARHGPIGASVRIGVAWALWHLPLFVLLADYDNAGTDVVSVVSMFAIFTAGLTIGLSVIQTWLYNRSDGSVFLAVLTHGAANASFAFLPTTWLPTAVASRAWGSLRSSLLQRHTAGLGPPLGQGEAGQRRDP
jgi:uncharacterized protein